MNTLKSRLHFGTFCGFGAGHCGHTHEKLTGCHVLWRQSRMQHTVTSALGWHSPAWMAVPMLMPVLSHSSWCCSHPAPGCHSHPHCQQAENLAFTPSSAQGKGCGCPPCPQTSQPRARTAPLPTVPPSSVLPVLLSGSDSFRHQIPPVRQES